MVSMSLQSIAKAMVSENKQIVADFRCGNIAALQFLVGKVMWRMNACTTANDAETALRAAIVSDDAPLGCNGNA